MKPEPIEKRIVSALECAGLERKLQVVSAVSGIPVSRLISIVDGNGDDLTKREISTLGLYLEDDE